jgi:hypothetical protein
MTAAPLPKRIRVPHPDRLSPAHPVYDDILMVHEAAVRADVDGYPDPASGSFVFTARYLDEQGHCCDNGCRHCPYLKRTDPA